MDKYVFFDLDGTLTASGTGIMNGIIFALSKFHIEIRDRAELIKFIGPSLTDSFMRFCGLTKEESLQGLEYYREYYKRQGMFESEVYAGIPEVLTSLRGQGFRLMLATSKPEETALDVLNHFGLRKYFDFIGAATMNEERTQKAEVIAHVLRSNGIRNKEGIIMVGDRRQDVEGAAAHGIRTIGALYGYGSREELMKAGATWIAEEPRDILRIISEGLRAEN